MFLGRKVRPVRRADSLTSIYDNLDNVDHHLTTLKASTACYGYSFTLWRRSVLPVRYELDCKYCYK
jgi:hypothetical protein